MKTIELENNSCNEITFQRIFKENSKKLHNFLYYKFGSDSLLEDKVQEAYIKLWENCKKVPPSKAKSFLFTVANNMMLNKKVHEKVVLKYSNQIKKNKSINNETPEFLYETNEFSEKIQKALASLTEAQRVALLMNRIEGKKHKEIALLLGISNKAVEKRIYGALKKIKENFAIKI